MTDVDRMAVIAHCPICGDPGYVTITGERLCGNARCEHTDALEVGVEMVSIPAADWRGAVEASRVARELLTAALDAPNEQQRKRLVRQAAARLNASGGQ